MKQAFKSYYWEAVPCIAAPCIAQVDNTVKQGLRNTPTDGTVPIRYQLVTERGLICASIDGLLIA